MDYKRQFKANLEASANIFSKWISPQLSEFFWWFTGFIFFNSWYLSFAITFTFIFVITFELLFQQHFVINIHKKMLSQNLMQLTGNYYFFEPFFQWIVCISSILFIIDFFIILTSPLLCFSWSYYRVIYILNHASLDL